MLGYVWICEDMLGQIDWSENWTVFKLGQVRICQDVLGQVDWSEN